MSAAAPPTLDRAGHAAASPLHAPAFTRARRSDMARDRQTHPLQAPLWPQAHAPAEQHGGAGSQQLALWEARFTGRPPAELLHWHCAQWAQSYLDEVARRVADPVAHVGGRDGRRQMVVLDILRVTVQADGQCSCELRALSEAGRASWVHVAERTIVLLRLPHRMLWLRRLERLARARLQSFWGLAPEMGVAELDAYAAWLFARAERLLRRHAAEDLRAMRSRIAAELAFDPQALRRAVRLALGAPREAPVRFAHYNLALQRAGEIGVLERDAPHLLQLYGALAGQLYARPRSGQPLADLRALLVGEEGLSPRVWRLLVHGNARLLIQMRWLYQRCDGAAVIDYLRVLDALQLSRQPPSWWMWVLLSLWGNGGARRNSYTEHFGESPRLQWLRHVARLCSAMPAQDQALAEPDTLEVLAYLADCAGAAPTRGQRQAGWTWLVLRARQAAAGTAHALTLQDTGQFPTPRLDHVAGEWRFIAIAGAAELWVEGQAMHHCIFTWLEDCKAGEALVVSVRHALHGKRVATAAYEAEEGGDGRSWRLFDVRGPANREVAPALRRAAAAVPAAMQRQTHRLAP